MTLTSFLIYLLAAVVLLHIPILGKYVAVIQTLIHEIGHGVMAIICGGKVKKIHLFANTEGLAFTMHANWFSRFITTLSGYVFASAFSFFSIGMITIGAYRMLLFIYVGLCLTALVLWIRNLYGFIWIVCASSVFLWLSIYGSAMLKVHILQLLTCILFAESIKSAFTILYLSIKRPKRAGDATSLAEMTKIIPAFIWGLLFFCQAVFFSYLSVNHIIQ
ncbi:M50 family metallopeptidase [Bacillales bacterium AN1005]|uniref:M50 family metallopeptidase n=1 Tax=Niallia taxi TaxID=2499688 RepID=UPI0021A6C7EA|nr:M50 family metallopeptidase [Niallia taxi]MCT2343379.1 M50 family metallopeptidase [Niallia taxi]